MTKRVKKAPVEERFSLELQKSIAPMTKNQGRAFDCWDNDQHLVLHGTAGTGKTFISLYLGIKEVLSNRGPRVLYIVRSAVPTRDVGFMPGTLEEKLEAYEAPYENLFNEILGRGDAYDILKKKGVVRFISTSFIRGITLDNAVVCVDEIQNMGPGELNTIITRVGQGTRIIFSGDVRQTDLTKSHDPSGLGDFLKILERIGCFSSIGFGVSDIVRSDLVRDYIVAREELEDLGQITRLGNV